MDHYLVLDIGGSHIKYAVMTEESILEKGEVVTPLDTSEHLIETLVTLIRRFEGRVKGLAMSVPGRINTREGIMHTGGYLGFIHDFPMWRSCRNTPPFTSRSKTMRNALPKPNSGKAR